MPQKFRVLVCGGRAYTDLKKVEEILGSQEWQEPISCIIEGGAPGADFLARLWAEKNGVAVMEFPAPWDIYGKAAGPIRNQNMLEYGRPHIVVAFPGGRGTEHMKRLARKRGIIVIEVE